MTRLSYTVSGDPHRPAIVFLHGFIGSGADWAHTISALDEHLYCIAPDLPGHGRSVGLTPQAYTINGAAKMLRDLLDGLGISRAALVGYSMGGRLALYLALRHPEECSGLFLESASPGIEDAAERELRREADEERASRLESDDFGEFLADWYRQPPFASLARHEGLVLETIETRLRNDPGELARSLRGMGAGSQPSLWGELAALQVPALAVAGELDEKFVGISVRMASLGPRIRAAVVPGAGHNVRLESPEGYLATLESFLWQPSSSWVGLG
ncbi:MAG: 2-succinyl-6-hydroxy-2,4-cyclohexadiene-1-carboxylate synthase [Actinomycetota bacterium]|nr:2-succinyl-6-hydroxy-2,4-cyclohexadiene-1-carboxylate synthase [Actinomycetota bacterium]